jgi:hypothetical protein
LGESIGSGDGESAKTDSGFSQNQKLIKSKTKNQKPQSKIQKPTKINKTFMA